jgi:hypothetical protein
MLLDIKYYTNYQEWYGNFNLIARFSFKDSKHNIPIGYSEYHGLEKTLYCIK